MYGILTQYYNANTRSTLFYDTIENYKILMSDQIKYKPDGIFIFIFTKYCFTVAEL